MTNYDKYFQSILHKITYNILFMLHNLNCSIALYKALSITAAAAQLVNGSSLAEALAYILRKG